MLAKCEAFSTFSTNDLNEAKKFYGDLLGLEISENKMGLLELDLVNHLVLIYPKPDHEPANFTVLNFKVNNLEEHVDKLTAKGVKFEQYDGVVKTDLKGIHRSDKGPSIAWFKDTAGNILSIIEEN
ncbi:VOC family protein [Gramella jeungdoensis]|uniref:VOC family protein n=1 Tax=Gramella jeungdoensis TaxID=708091 RepID=A0ABT0Z329_9FLAO|nr:VOC family protein [Gramella jeungdoensis]MCM8570137.1 VOC family protein [Gramella jeungdoensis]